jgi:hypothetical protein
MRSSLLSSKIHRRHGSLLQSWQAPPPLRTASAVSALLFLGAIWAVLSVAGVVRVRQRRTNRRGVLVRRDRGRGHFSRFSSHTSR